MDRTHAHRSVLAIIIDQEKTLKIDGPEDFEKHMLLNVVSRLVCRAIRAENMPLDMDDVVAITESVYTTRPRRCSTPPQLPSSTSSTA